MYLLNGLLLITTFHFSMNYFLNDKYKNYLCKISYNILYNYGIIEIYLKENYTKILKNYYVDKILDNIEYFYKYFNNYFFDYDTELIINNNIVSTCRFSNIFSSNNYENLNNIELFIYTENIKNDKANKFIYYDISELTTFYNIYEKCDYEFLSINIHIKNLNNDFFINFNLANNKETYYLVNNKINVIFISYLLKTKYNINVHPSKLQYNINFIDQNAEFLNLNEKAELVLFKDCYEIIPYEYKVHKNLNIDSYNFTTKNEYNNFVKEENTISDNISDTISDNSYEKVD